MAGPVTEAERRETDHRALGGVRIVWLSAPGPIPLAAMLLSDLGADVIRVDRPGAAAEVSGLGSADDPRTRGQRTIGVDLKSQRGSEVLRRLLASTDVFIEGMRPGAAERLGLAPDQLRAANPGLIFARMTGWGQSGPYALVAGHDINYIAIAGALHPIGSASEPPAIPLNLIGDFGGGSTYLAIAILAALIQRSTTGTGQVIDCAMVDGVASLTTLFHGMLAAGIWSENRADNLFDGAAPFYRTYRTADDRYVAVGALEPKFYAELLTGLGMDPADWPQHDRKRWPAQREAIAAVFVDRDRDHWELVFDGTDACVTPVLSLREAASSAYLSGRGTFVDWDGVAQPAPAPRLSDSPPTQRPRARRCEHTDEVLAQAGYTVEDIGELRAQRVIG
ncbi:MAG: CaiB/BaiF CoA-transferase family protein [Mycobacterium sp.]